MWTFGAKTALNGMRSVPIRRRLLTAGAAIALAVGLFTGAMATSSHPAEASWNYQVTPYRVCQWQYSNPGLFFIGASTWQPWNPYAIYCYGLSGFGWGVLGGLNIQGYCSARYPGSVAVVIRDDWWAFDDWYCRFY